MAHRLSILYTARPDGNGNPRDGYYFLDHGIPIGCAHATEQAAYDSAREYLRDCMKQIQGAGLAICHAAKGGK